jgi:Bacterial membrane protein YfhO
VSRLPGARFQVPGSNSISSSDVLVAARRATDRTGAAEEKITRTGRALTSAWFWLAGILFALITWWPLGIRPASGLQGGDVYTYFFPLKAWYADRLRAGELPLWNPLVGHGFPALGESQTGVFYPFHLVLYRYLGLNAAYHLNFLLHYVLAFGFTCHYVRRIGFSFSECILAAVIFVYGWFPARSCLEWSIITGAWIPLAFWGVERFVSETRRGSLLATEIAIAMQLLAGHFNLAFVTLVGLMLYVPFRLLLDQCGWKQVFRQSVLFAVAALLACGVAAVQLIPSWELKNRSQRSTPEFAEQQVGYGSIPLAYLTQIVQPWRVYPRVSEPAFERAQLGGKNTNKVEAHLYFGLIPMILAGVGVGTIVTRKLRGTTRAEDRPIWTWLLIGAVSLTLALGTWTALSVHLPGFGYFTGPGRYGVLVQLAIAVAASTGMRCIREWFATESAHYTWLTWATWFVGCIAIMVMTDRWTAWSGGATGFVGSLFPVRSRWCTAVECGLLIIGVWVIISWVMVLVRRPASLFTITSALVAWADVMSVAQFVQFAEIRTDSPIHHLEFSTVRMLLQRYSPTAYSPTARMLARDQNAMSLCGAATVPVYLGIGPREYFGGALQVPAEFHWETSLTPNTLSWLRWAAVSHVLSFEAMQDQSLEPVWRGYDPLLHELLGRPPEQALWLYKVLGARERGYWVPATDESMVRNTAVNESIPMKPVTNIHVGANEVRMSMNCDEAAIVVLCDLMYPGWIVFVDGHRADPIDDNVFRAVRVDAGAHDIRWRYRPLSLTIGLVVSICALGGSVLFYGLALFYRRRSQI